MPAGKPHAPAPHLREYPSRRQPGARQPRLPGDGHHLHGDSHLYARPGLRSLQPAKLIDSIPPDTTFVPGSATGGIAPVADGALNWTVNPSATPQTFIFKVVVDESQCSDPRQVTNRAGLIRNGLPAVGQQRGQPPGELPAHPAAERQPRLRGRRACRSTPTRWSSGHPSTISVRLTNLTTAPQPVTVTFQSSPDQVRHRAGYDTFDTRSVTLPASGSVIVQSIFVPVQSGHCRLQIVVSGPALAAARW